MPRIAPEYVRRRFQVGVSPILSAAGSAEATNPLTRKMGLRVKDGRQAARRIGGPNWGGAAASFLMGVVAMGAANAEDRTPISDPKMWAPPLSGRGSPPALARRVRWKPHISLQAKCGIG